MIRSPSRRLVLGSAAAWSLAPGSLLARTFDDRLPTVEEQAAEMRRLVKILGGEARVERLGHSRAGRPIDMISVGKGPLSALVVGAPHANEPIGCLTILTLLDRLAHDRRFRQDGGVAWHFIPAIDIDGIAMNQGWFSGPLTLDRYTRDFFRPAFKEQPEYAFPLQMPGYAFDAATPENLCWQAALALTRPRFQSSLHGADSGGDYYLISAPNADLAKALSRIPTAFGQPLNRLGETDIELTAYAPGVLASFEIKPMLEQAAAQNLVLSDAWSAGASSAEFAAERYQTFSMVSEVSLWRDGREVSDKPSTRTMASIVRAFGMQAEEDAGLLAAAAPSLDEASGSLEVRAIRAALVEARDGIDKKRAGLDRQARSADAKTPVRERDLVELEPGLIGLRTPAMAARLARLVSDEALQARASAVLSKRIAAQRAAAPLRPVPYRSSAAAQAMALTTSVKLLAEAGG